MAAALVLVLSAESRCGDAPPPPRAHAKVSFGKVTLKSGEVIEADVAREVGDSVILRTPDGLRVVPKALIESNVAGAEIDDPPAKASVKPVAPKAGEGKAAADPKAAPKDAGKASPKDARDGADAAPKAPSTRVAVLPDKRLDEARAAGAQPVLEIALGGTINGQPVNAADAFAIPRLTFFFTGESQPRFDVPPPPAVEKGKVKPAAKTGAKPAEYQARISGETSMLELTFYGTPLMKTFRSQVRFELVRLADKKVIVQVETSEDEGGDPGNREEGCRLAWRRAIESLVRKLKEIRTFGGSSSGSEIDGNAKASR